jgi:mycothiol system anti-sigma-R factor
MADCEETLREIERYLDGELTDTTRGRVQAHLDGCMDCLELAEFHLELRHVVARKAQSDPLPPGLLDRIRSCFGPGAGAELPPD